MIPSWLWLLPLPVVANVATENGLDKNILASMIMVESSGKLCAKNYEAGYKYLYNPSKYAKELGISERIEKTEQQTAWGPLQITGATMRELGYKKRISDICNHDKLALDYGARYFKLKLHKYGNHHDAVAAYNAGSVRIVDGEYVNKRHVNRVFKYLKELEK